MSTLSRTRERTAAAISNGDTSAATVLRFLKASLQEGANIDALDDDIRCELPAETLDRYAVAFKAVAGRPFNRALDSIVWDEAG